MYRRLLNKFIYSMVQLLGVVLVMTKTRYQGFTAVSAANRFRLVLLVQNAIPCRTCR